MCTGAPGILTGAWDYLREYLLLAGAELIWQAGAHGDGVMAHTMERTCRR